MQDRAVAGQSRYRTEQVQDTAVAGQSSSRTEQETFHDNVDFEGQRG